MKNMLARGIASVPFLMALAVLSRVVDASMYQKVGDGLCQPEQGDAYGYMRTQGKINTVTCSEACDSVNLHHPETVHHYRGFSHVNHAYPDLDLYKGYCFCHYDCHHLPNFSDDLLDVWTRHEPEDITGEGRIGSTDGTPHVGCYEVVVEETVTPEPDAGITWAGYHDVHEP